MRYLISKSKEESIRSRQQYIYEVFNLYTIRKEKSEHDFIELDSFPLNNSDYLFIIGHDNEAISYLEENIEKIQENNIVVICCNTERMKKISKINNTNKSIFIPKEQIINFYNGNKWNFSFDITDIEIDLYNKRHKNISEVLLEVMKKL